MTAEPVAARWRDFIRDIARPISTQRHSRIVTRFPPERRLPAYRHAKAIALNSASAGVFRGSTCGSTIPMPTRKAGNISIQSRPTCTGRLRLGNRSFFCIGLFRTSYEWAEGLIRAGHAYVDTSRRRIRIKRRHPDQPATTARSATAPSMKTSICFDA